MKKKIFFFIYYKTIYIKSILNDWMKQNKQI